MNKKTVLNGIMILLIVSIALSGLLLVKRMKDPPLAEESPASEFWLVASKSGNVNIYRGGLAYALKEGDRLRTDDSLETLNRAALTLHCGEQELVLDGNSRLNFHSDTAFTLEKGGAFLTLRPGLCLTVNGAELTGENAVILASAASGSGTVSVLSGEAALGSETLRAGQRATILSEIEIGELKLEACSAFELRCIRDAARPLCFSAADVALLEQQREAEKQKALEAAFLEEQPVYAETVVMENEENEPVSTPEVFLPVCTIEIRCDTILDNLADLTAGKGGYVPQNGVILAASKVTFHEGDTAFDVLKKACELAGIHLEYAWTPGYDSYYIEGINNLYEFDCGEQSGWMYKVNGWFPNYGCSSYKLEDGDVMVWCFTCKGLGADVGGEVW